MEVPVSGSGAARPVLCAAGENRDRTPVDRAGGERATNRELHAGGSVVAAEQQHIDDLPGGVRASVAVGQPGPQLVEAVGPGTAVAFLGQRDGALQSARLVGEQLKERSSWALVPNLPCSRS